MKRILIDVVAVIILTFILTQGYTAHKMKQFHVISADYEAAIKTYRKQLAKLDDMDGLLAYLEYKDKQKTFDYAVEFLTQIESLPMGGAGDIIDTLETE